MGFWEIVLVVLVLLVVLGPKRLPEFTKKAGQLWHQMQQLMQKFKRDLDK